MEKQIPLTLYQQELYGYYLKYPTNSMYNNTVVFKIQGYLDCEKLENIFDMVLNSIDIFKSDLIIDNDRFYLQYDSEREFKTGVFYLKDISDKQLLRRVKHISSYLNSRESDYDTWPLAEVNIYNNDNDLSYCIISYPMVLIDNHSICKLLSRVSYYYNHIKNTGDIKFYMVQNNKFNENIEQDKVNEVKEYSDEYYKKYFRGIEDVSLNQIKTPFDDKGNRKGNGKIKDIGKIRAIKLKDYFNKNNVNCKSFFALVLSLFIVETSRSKTVTFGNVETEENDDVLGNFQRVIPVLYNCDTDKKVSEVLNQFDDLFIEASQAEYNESLNKTINVLYSITDDIPNLKLNRVQSEAVETVKDTSIADFSMRVMISDSDYTLFLNYGQYFDDVDICRYIMNYIDRIIANPDIKISNLLYTVNDNETFVN